MHQQREDALIEQLKEVIRTGHYANGEPTLHPQWSGPLVTEEELIQAETQLGFVLPSFLRRVYLEVGNGEFGPGYGFFPLNIPPSSSARHADSLVTTYQEMRSMTQKDIDEYWADDEEKPALWPERVLILCDWGCNVYSCLDCSSSNLPIFRMDSNVNFMVEWIIEASSLQEWLEMWIDGKPLFHVDWEQVIKVSVSRLIRDA